MIEKIEKAISDFGMQKIYDGVVLGLSGGADSSLLLYYLVNHSKKVVAVHINHMIRGKEADRDEEFCREICKKYNVEFLPFKLDIPRLAAENKKGIEETAREERYRIFDKVLSEYPDIECIATAHNSDDNAETVIFNLTRGCGLNGLCGINPVKGNIYRPLIYCSKEEIVGYCKENRIGYVNDSTNTDTKYTRNFIRHEIIPKLEKINENFLTGTIRMCKSIREDNEFFDNLCDKIVKDNCIEDKIGTELAKTLEKPVLYRLLKKISNQNLDNISMEKCLNLIYNCKNGKSIELQNGTVLKKEHGYIHFIKESELLRTEYRKTIGKDKTYIEETDTYICFDDLITINGYELSYEIPYNEHSISGAIIVRNRKDGDRIFSKGMNKKVKNLFLENHIPAQCRDLYPVFEDDKGIFLIPWIAARDGVFNKQSNKKIFIYKKSGGKNDKQH